MNNIKRIIVDFFVSSPSTADGSSPQGFAAHEDFESKRTTKLGMVFIIIMVITGVWQGQSLFNAVSSSITPPENLSGCYYQLLNESKERIVVGGDTSANYSRSSRYSYQDVGYGYNGYGNGYYNGVQESCHHSQIENVYGVGGIYESVRSLLKMRYEKEGEVTSLNQRISQAGYDVTLLQNSYNTALMEVSSNTDDPVYGAQAIAKKLKSKEDDIAKIKEMVTEKEQIIASLTSEIQTIVSGNVTALRSVADDFNGHIKWLELKRFLVSIILLAPLTYFAVRKYFRSKNERSEYAIIWSGFALIMAVLSSQLLVVFAYRILPHRLLQAIIDFFPRFFDSFKFLFVIFQWLGLIILPLFFAFLVYKIQKKYYNKEAIMMRALKDNKCPQCSMKIKDQMVFCPSCSYALRKTCGTCKHTSISYARFCEECGISFKEGGL